MIAAVFLLLSAAPAAGLDTLDIPSVAGSGAASPEDAAARRTGTALAEDPAAAEALAERILASSLAETFPAGENPRADLVAWIRRSPQEAGRLALGFAQDDARGDHAFERSLYERVKNRFELNPERYQGLLGRLSLTAEESRKIAGLETLSDGERHKLLKAFFEGRSSGTEDAGKENPEKSAPVAPSGIYDRLGSLNLSGYSPHVQAMQSDMNRRGAPGAPRLIETGRLDYATLRHPYFGLRYDIDGLTRRLAEQTASAGPENLARRKGAVARAESALAAFSAEADMTKTPKGLTRARLERLAALRRETARWIAYAAQEERSARLAFMSRIVTDELRALAAAAPVEEAERRGFLAYGRRLENEFREAGKDAQEAARLLAPAADSPAPEDWMRAEKAFNETRKRLGRLAAARAEYLAAAAASASAAPPPGAARGLLESWAARLFPSSDYAVSSARKREAREKALSAFRRFARGAR